jgi:sugar/nucleoside kinase (ribokinase family)
MKNMLIYGDVMVDRNWIVSGRTEATAQKHADVPPMRRIAPQRLDDSLGGAGMTASAVAHLCARFCKAHLLAASGVIDTRVLGGVELIQIPRRHADQSVTTIKMRIYNINEKGLPTLRHRFDQDAPPPDATDELPANLPSPSHLIVSDFSKGAVKRSLLRKLLERFPDAEIFVDTKNSALFEKCPELVPRAGVLFINRDEATRLWQLYRSPGSDLDISLALHHCLADLLEMGGIFLQKLPGWSVVVKLDHDGAVLFHNNQFYVQDVTTPSNTAGIGAGDVFLASWLQGVFLGARDRGQLLAHATISATTWVGLAGIQETWNAAWEAEREAPNCTDIPVPSSLPDSFPSGSSIKTGIEEERARSTYPACIANGILNLRSAECGLGKFRVLNPSRRREVMRFARRIHEYLARDARTRPFNCVLAARPGTGKSFLLRQLETSSLPFYEVNVAQFASSSEFMGELARIAAKGDRQRILLIDEADTKLSGHHIYSLLLTPLWDGTVMYRGERLDLGSHFVSVLVTSTCETPAAFRQSLREAVSEKGPDLESRLNGADLTLIAPTGAADGIPLEAQENLDADYAVLIGSIVRRYYPHVRWVCREFLDLLYEKHLPPRDLEYAVLRLESPGDAYIKPEDVAKLRLTFGETKTSTVAEHGSKMIQIIDVS